MNKKLWLLGIAATAAVTTAIVLSVCREKARHQKKLAVVSDAGYETAFDVHFPLKRKPHRRKGFSNKGS